MSSPSSTGIVQPPPTHHNNHPARAGQHSVPTAPASAPQLETYPQQQYGYGEGYDYYEISVPSRGAGEYNDYVNMLFKDGGEQSDESSPIPNSGDESPSTSSPPLSPPLPGKSFAPRPFQFAPGYYPHAAYYQQPYYADPNNPYSAQLMYQHMYQSPLYAYYSQPPHPGADFYIGHDERMYGHQPPQGFVPEGDEADGQEVEDASEAHTQLLAKQAAAQALTMDVDADPDADGEESGDPSLYRRLENLAIQDGTEQKPASPVPRPMGRARPIPIYYPPMNMNPIPPQHRPPGRSWADLVKDGQGGAQVAPPPSMPMPMPYMMPPHPQMIHQMPPHYAYPTPAAAAAMGQGKVNWRQPMMPPQDQIPRYPQQNGRGGGHRGRGEYRGRGRGRGGYNGQQGPSHRRSREQNEDESQQQGDNQGHGQAHRRRGQRSDGPATPKILGLNHLAGINPATLNLEVPQGNARFFVIKSYSEDDVHKAIKYQIWTSTDSGNKRLDRAFKEQQQVSPPAPVYLLFSVNASGKFCGIAEMTSGLDYSAKSTVWNQTDKWTGQFTLRWVYIKDVPNGQFRHIRLANNENKPVTNSRDTQEVPSKQGKEVVKIVISYALRSSILDDWEYYETAEEQHKAKLDQKKKNPDVTSDSATVASIPAASQSTSAPPAAATTASVSSEAST